jgi:hypothetical protein
MALPGVHTGADGGFFSSREAGSDAADGAFAGRGQDERRRGDAHRRVPARILLKNESPEIQSAVVTHPSAPISQAAA